MRRVVLPLTLAAFFGLRVHRARIKASAQDGVLSGSCEGCARTNPVKATPESIAQGKKIYGYDCASCHGATGDGKTDVAKDLKMPDLTIRRGSKIAPTENFSTSSRTDTATCRPKAIA